MDGNTGMENGRHKDLEAMIYIDFWVSQLYSSGAIKDKVGEAHYKKYQTIERGIWTSTWTSENQNLELKVGKYIPGPKGI